mmetsp:Transcript_38696/g.61740  ORF Transcript_38696/g.61740 Transcript_38696/m.61740 type:complete len:278 (+) Transcript_38696:81-914(+)
MQGINDCCPAVLDGVIVSVRHFHYEQQLLWPEAVAEPGTHIDIYDVIYSKWYPGQVIEIGEDENSGKVKVTYHGYSARFDEYIEMGSWRLAPLNTYTRPDQDRDRLDEDECIQKSDHMTKERAQTLQESTRKQQKKVMVKFAHSALIPTATVKVKPYGNREQCHYPGLIMDEPSLLMDLLEIVDKALSVYTCTSRVRWSAATRRYYSKHSWKKREIAGSQIVELRPVLLSVVPDLWMMYHVVFDYMGYQNMKSSIVTLTLQSTPWYLVCLSTTEIFE